MLTVSMYVTEVVSKELLLMDIVVISICLYTINKRKRTIKEKINLYYES